MIIRLIIIITISSNNNNNNNNTIKETAKRSRLQWSTSWGQSSEAQKKIMRFPSGRMSNATFFTLLDV